MLLVESASGRAMSMQGQVLAEVTERWARAGEASPQQAGEQAADAFEGELNEEQIEVGSRPHEDLGELTEELLGWRRRAGLAARRMGARVAAVGLCPTEVTPRTVRSERYDRITELYGITAEEQLTCGCHVHVSVADRDEAVGVIDRIRGWLPVLTALSANSPFWQGRDTSYAAYRSPVMNRWPSAGPTDVFGSAEAYDRLVEDMVATGVLLDPGMVYFDARPSQNYPTVEIRVADVCLDVEDTAVVAALCRGLVERAAAEYRAETAPVPTPVTLLRLAGWRAARDGMGGELLDPVTMRPRPAWDAVGTLLEHVREPLRSAGDEELVTAGLDRIRRDGTGADRQRRVHERTGTLEDVVADAVRVTEGRHEDG